MHNWITQFEVTQYSQSDLHNCQGTRLGYTKCLWVEPQSSSRTSEVAEEMMSALRDIFLFSVTRVLVLTVPVTLILEVSGQNIIPEFKTPFDEDTKGNVDYISTYSTPLFHLVELDGILKLLSQKT